MKDIMQIQNSTNILQIMCAPISNTYVRVYVYVCLSNNIIAEKCINT